MNNYDEIKNLYDNNFIYNNEFPNYKKIAEKLKKKDAVMANQCTCSNCNCRSANNMVNLSKLYKEKLSNA